MRMPRVQTCLLGAGILVAALAVTFVIILIFFPGCSELETQEALPPDGKYIARLCG